MDPDRWRRIRDVLHAALERPPEQRSAYLAAACGADVELRAEVESLVGASEQPAWIDQRLEALETQTLDMPAEPLAPGQRIGHYRVVQKLGEGGMGVVYKAIDANLDRTVALKVLLPDRQTPRLKQRFIREAKAASALNHPNIVTIYEFGSDNGLDFIAMEFVEGVTIQELLERRQTPRETLLGYAQQAAGAIAKAHAAGIVHRDLKPNNLMATRDGVVKVLDFGLAKHNPLSDQDSDATQSLSLTIAGAIAGTPAYMSPEQATGETIDWRSDIFSFGIILYEIACGQRPFKGSNAQATLHQIASADPPKIASLDSSAPPRLVALIERCLQKPREQRVQSMQEVAAELAAILHRPVAVSRRPVAAGILAAAVVAALAGTGVWFARRPVPSPATPNAAAKVRSLNLSLVAQQMAGGKPSGDPYVASPTDTFQGGWRFRVRAEPHQSGFLYLINDGPDESGHDRLFILYPPDGEARAPLTAGQPAETGWYVFDANPGTERLWIVWSEQPVEALAASGRVTSPDLERTIRDLLGSLRPGKFLAETGSLGLEGETGTLGGLLELRHE